MLTDIDVTFFMPEEIDVNFIVYNLTGGDISKASIIENEFIDTCYSWYYLYEVKQLNKLIYQVAELEKLEE